MFTGTFVAIFLLVVMATGAPLDPCEGDTPVKPQYDLGDAPALFEKYVKDYNKIYKDEADKQVHYEAFLVSLKRINELNSDPNQTATFDINKFADYTDEQRKKMRGLLSTKQ